MALEAGGYAEKLGNKYEANWIAYQLLRLLEEKIAWVSVEPLGDDEVGVDVIAGLHDNQCEYYQCKAGSGNREYWTLSKLNQSKILSNAQFHIDRGSREFHLVSPLNCKVISDLSDSALNTNGNPRDFVNHQINTSTERQKSFASICGYLSLDISDDGDVQKAINLLQRFKITPYNINQHTQTELEDKAAKLFSGVPIKLVNFLKNYVVEFNKLRQKITTQDLLQDLKSSGFSPRLVPDDDRIAPVIERLSIDFEDSIRPFLICSQLISRAELNDVIQSVNQNAITLVKAEAGMGKSALLLELHQKLSTEGTISIPIRLDRKRPENNVDAFGQSLGFPYSPVLSVSKYAKDKKFVFILDQLDAIRWTAGHSNNALQICQELVRQILSLRNDGLEASIVLASRDFDISEDIALSSWIASIKDDLKDFHISNLDENTVEKLISPFESYKTISEEKKRTLQVPLWLSIYLTIANRTQSAPRFNNKLELVKKYWEDRISLVKTLNTSEQDVARLIDEIVVLMTSRSRLAISENSLSIGTQNSLDALLSVGVLTRQKHRISFRHQALYDYQVGIKLFNAGIDSSSKLISEIGDFSHQTLTKREHLKYALNMLLDSEQQAFCDCAETILLSDKIRFHLKYLTLNSIKELTNLTKPAKSMIDKIIAEPELLSKFISTCSYKNADIIRYLSDTSKISDWLNGSDDELIETSIRLLHSIADSNPEIVIKELKPFVGISELWNNRVYRGLCWDIEKDSDSMFELRLELFTRGCNVDFIDWKALSQKVPERALTLIELMLSHYKGVLCLPRYSPEALSTESFARRDNWSASEIDEITQIANLIPEEVLERLLTLIYSFLGDLQDEEVAYQWLQKDDLSRYEVTSSLTHGVFSLILHSGQMIASEDRLLELIRPYLNSDSPVINYLIANLMLNLSEVHADLTIGWLLDNPESRFRCGNTYAEPEWILPGKLITKFSQHCSEHLLEKLEENIYSFKTKLTIDNIKWRLEARRRGMYYSFWGETQHFLLPCLPKSLISDNSKQLIGVLKRKFSDYSDYDFCSVSNRSGGVVTSPLPIGNRLSDKSWKKIILTPEDEVNTGNWKQVGAEVITEVSVEQFSRTLEVAVKNEPERFANFALSLPKDINNKYVRAFFWGLTKSNPSRITKGYLENWQQCPVELTEKVIEHFGDSGNESAIARLIESRVDDESWSPATIALLEKIAQTAEDPCFNKLNVRDIKKSENASEADVETLRGNAINCTRGIAYGGIARVFRKDQAYAIKHQSLIDSAINDFHPAVNITAVDLLLPMSNYDKDFADSKFLELCNKDLRMTSAYGAHHFFNNGFEGHQQSKYVELVLQMLKSSYDDVKKEAARQVYARWFFNDLFQNEVSLVLDGDEILQEGCASVVQQFLREDKHHDKIHKVIPAYSALLNCENEDVLRTVGGSVRNQNYWEKHNATQLFDIFVQSKAAKYCLWELFEQLSCHPRSISEFSAHLYQLIDNLTGDTSEDVRNKHMRIRETSIIKVLQRLYDEATEEEDKSTINVCLDIWDRILSSEVYAAINAVNELDKGLLS
ncbi:hypothetical protein [Neptunicella sp.]|uniref:hypothetical protein n=1 Tax=Neptunicella sp. TaxID=2125986 RepID=UPI003F6918C0